MGAIYIVGEKSSFVHAGRMYKPEDEIDSDLFSKTDLEAAIKGGKLLTPAQFKALSEKKGVTLVKPKALDEMNVEELKVYAAGTNIAVAGSKAEILAAIKAAEAPPKTLDDMNLDELKSYAKEKNISTKSGPLPWQNMNRDDLLAAIKAAEAENGK